MDPESESSPDDSEPSEPGDTDVAADRDDDSQPTQRRRDDAEAVRWVRELLTSVALVLLIGLVLVAVSGIWPPMVAVESGSMDPNMKVGDLIFLTATDRFVPDAAHDHTGVVTYEAGQQAGYRSFGSYGSVIVFDTPGSVGSPIIHRAMFHVEAGEDWYDRADPEHIDAGRCEELQNCPAPHAGFVTKGDANDRYDQAHGDPPVKPGWMTGIARVRIPYLGYVRLLLAFQAAAVPSEAGTQSPWSPAPVPAPSPAPAAATGHVSPSVSATALTPRGHSPGASRR